MIIRPYLFMASAVLLMAASVSASEQTLDVIAAIADGRTDQVSHRFGHAAITPAADRAAPVLSVDTTGSDADWNEVAVLRAGQVAPNHRYQITLRYRVIERHDADTFFYVVPKADGEKKPWVPFITWQGEPSERRTLVQRVLLPEAEQWRLILGVHGRGKMQLETFTIESAPRLTRAELLAAGESLGASSDAEPFEPFGICQHATNLWLYRDEQQVRQAFALIAHTGAQWIRADVSWNQLMPDGPNSVDLRHVERLDLVMQLAAEHGIDVFLQLFRTARWASSRPDEKAYWAYASRDINDWRAFVRFMAERYGDRVHHWEIGNEADWHFWRDTLDSHVERIKAAYAELKAHDPRHKVMNGGLSTDGVSTHILHNGGEIDALQRMYDLGLAQHTDILALHIYPTDAEDAVYRVNRFRAIMARNGDADKPLWITEAGMTTQGGRHSERDQARLVTEMYYALARHPHVERVFWWNLRCVGTDPDKPVDHFGLVEHDFTPRPAYDAFVELTKPEQRYINQRLADVE